MANDCHVSSPVIIYNRHRRQVTLTTNITNFAFRLLPVFLIVFTIITPPHLPTVDAWDSRNQCKKGYPYEKILLSLQWPPGVCFKNVAKSCIVNVDRFLIHGSWPTNTSTSSSPEFCCNERFDLEQLAEIEQQLLDKWRTIFAGSGNDQSFWRHEWSKHGTCASTSSPPMSGLATYFKNTLALYDRVPILKWLNDDNIKPEPSVSYSIKDIHSSIEKHTANRRVYLECKRVSRADSPDPILTEIRVCFRPIDLEFTDCQYRDDNDCGNKMIRFISNTTSGTTSAFISSNLISAIVVLTMMTIFLINFFPSQHRLR